MKTETQKERILWILKTRKRVPAYLMSTPQPLGGAGCLQYNARILELRRMGYDIRNKTDENGHTYFELITENQQTLF